MAPHYFVALWFFCIAATGALVAVVDCAVTGVRAARRRRAARRFARADIGQLRRTVTR